MSRTGVELIDEAQSNLLWSDIALGLSLATYIIWFLLNKLCGIKSRRLQRWSRFFQWQVFISPSHVDVGINLKARSVLLQWKLKFLDIGCEVCWPWNGHLWTLISRNTLHLTILNVVFRKLKMDLETVTFSCPLIWDVQSVELELTDTRKL